MTEEVTPNLVQMNDLFERIGVGLNRDEMYWYDKWNWSFDFPSQILVRKDMATDESISERQEKHSEDPFLG